MFIFGTIGIFRRWIDLPSAVIVLFRCVIGVLLLLIVMLSCGKKPELSNLGRSLPKLILSGLFLGFNWVLLFEAYNLTSVAVATLCYYMAPVIVVLLSPLLFGEHLGPLKLLFTALALVGMIFVSGVYRTGFGTAAGMSGIMVGLGAAVFYAALIISNKKITGVDALEKTVIQLASAALIVLIYVLLRGDFSGIQWTSRSVALLLVVGIVHTGIAYLLYVGSMEKLNAQTVAFYGYIDPIVAILSSALLLHEHLGPGEIIGSILILGASFMSDFVGNRTVAGTEP